MNFITQILLILVIMFLSATGALLIRLKKGPLDLNFAKDTIESALSDKQKNYIVTIGDAKLIWPEIAAPLLIYLRSVKILQGESEALDIDNFSFSLSGLGIIQGKILPSQIIVNNPKLKILNADGKINKFWEEQEEVVQEDLVTVENPEITEARTARGSAAKVRNNIRKILADIANSEDKEYKSLSALKMIKIKNAILTDDKEGSEALAFLNLDLERSNLGLNGDISVRYPDLNGKEAIFKSEVLYRKAEGDLIFSASLKDLHTSQIESFLPDVEILAQQDLYLNGEIRAAFDKDLKLEIATMNFAMPEGKIVLSEIYDEPVPLKNIVFNAQLNRLEKFLDISNFTATVGDVPITATAKASFSKEGIIAPLQVKILELPVASIPPIFPKSQLDSAAGHWLTKAISKGTLHDIVLNAELAVHRNPETHKRDFALNKPQLSFRGDGLTIQYSDTLKPVTEADAEGVFEDDVLTIKSSTGKIGAVVGKNVEIKLTDIMVAGGGHAYVTLDASGPLKSALDFVSDEPINAGKNLGFDITKVEGDVDFNLKLDFPTLKELPKDRVNVTLNGTANNILLPSVVRGMSLSGGPFALGFDKGAITLKGQGKLEGREIDLDWMEYFDAVGKDYESKIIAKVTADESLRDVFGIGLKDYISGDISVNVTYTDYGKKAVVDVEGDLTPTTLHIAPFKYNKASGVAGTIKLKANIDGADLVSVDDLKIDTENFSIANANLKFKTLSDGTNDIAGGKIGAVKLGKTTAAVDFDVSADNLLKVSITGDVVDITPFVKANSTDKKSEVAVKEYQPMQISVASPKLLGNQGEVMSGAKIYLELNKNSEPTRIEMDGKLGSSSMNLRFIPDATGIRNFNMQSTDAGKTLRFFGLYNNMRGGKMVVSGNPNKSKEGDDLFGTAQITDFNIRKAPALAKLMSVMSLQGVNALLSNDGLSFQKLAGNFEWHFRDNGNLLVIKDGRTSGNSLGLTFEGVVNMGTDQTDISGTVIPLSTLNKAVGQIPIIGEILTGGDALFAATYSMKGNSDDPKVSVNPLSVLAPGFLRKILFEGDVDSKVKKQESKR